MQLVLAPGSTFANGAGAAAAAMNIAGVTQGNSQRRGSLGNGVDAVAKRDEHGMIANPLLRNARSKQIDM